MKEVYPNGKYSDIYSGTGSVQENAFDMTRKTFYFIFDTKLRDNLIVIIWIILFLKARKN